MTKLHQCCQYWSDSGHILAHSGKYTHTGCLGTLQRPISTLVEMNIFYKTWFFLSYIIHQRRVGHRLLKPFTMEDILQSQYHCCWWPGDASLQWRHNERDGVSYYQRLDCLLNRLFRHKSKKISKPRGRHWPLCGVFTGDWWIPCTKGQ